MAFYPDKKDGMSPSALAQWLNSRAAFIRSYFMGERGPETKAMATGTQMHALIQAGLLKAKHVFAASEQDIAIEIMEGFTFRGRPDSHDTEPFSIAGEVTEIRFVDYKSGKANAWAEKLPTDIKMRATAWLVWRAGGKPDRVRGYIEFFQTIWDPERHAVVPLDGHDSEVVEIVYTRSEMEAFEKVIVQEMVNVGVFYEKWKESTGEFVHQDDVDEYVALTEQIAKLETERDEVGERIAAQMEVGGEENHKTAAGSFYFKTTDTYEYPEDLTFLLDGEEEYTLGKAERVASGVKAAKKNFELANEPKSTKRSIAFRAAKAK